MRLITFPRYVSEVCGFPPCVRLTDAESKAMARVHLGGLGALRTDTHKTGCRTINALVAKGMLESLEQCTMPDGSVRRGGLTALGKAVAEVCADAEHAAVVS